MRAQVIDENQATLACIRLTFEGEGHEVAGRWTSAAGLLMAAQLDPELVFDDPLSPGLPSRVRDLGVPVILDGDRAALAAG